MKHANNMVVKNAFIIFSFFTLITNSCATGIISNNDAGTDASDCSETIDLENDLNNCGSCGNICPRSFSDRCIEGECVCGNLPETEISGRFCNELDKEECKLGACATAELSVGKGGDREATVCEWDHQCTGARLCVRGVCSEVPCADIGGNPQVIPCYTGPPGTQYNGECMEGYRVCFSGMWGKCEEEVLPVPENGILNCDGLDNDCDGCPDGNWVGDECIETEVRNFDILFIMDNSTSMSSRCDSVVEAMSMLGGEFAGNDSFHWAVEKMPYENQCYIGIFQDFVVYDDDFQATFDELECNDGSMEANWDAVVFAIENVPLYNMVTGEMSRLSWREGATRVIIVFSDEQGQSYNHNPELGLCGGERSGPNNESTMCDAISNELVAYLTTASYTSDFDCDGSGATTVYLLVDDAATMVKNLRAILESACAE